VPLNPVEQLQRIPDRALQPVRGRNRICRETLRPDIDLALRRHPVDPERHLARGKGHLVSVSRRTASPTRSRWKATVLAHVHSGTLVAMFLPGVILPLSPRWPGPSRPKGPLRERVKRS
jgi:hypothetical protein